MFAQNTHWSSGEFNGTPSTVTFIRLPAAPRIRMYVVPVPTPFSLHAITPGVRAKRNGNSLPVVANCFNSCFLMLATANGDVLGALTALTTTSLMFCTFVVSSLVCAFVANGHAIAAVIAALIIFFMLLLLYLI